MEGISVYSMQTMPKTREHPWIMDQGEPWAAGRNGAVGMEEQFSMFSPLLAKFVKFKGSEVPVELGVQQGGDGRSVTKQDRYRVEGLTDGK